MRRLVILACALFIVEASLYASVAPLLPHYAHALRLSKTAAGTFVAAYPAGLIIGSLLVGWLGRRVSVRTVTFAGTASLALATAAFGFATSTAGLDALRALQGVAAGGLWGGAFAWLTAAAPPERRGRVIGTAFAAWTFGSLFGPVIGTVAVGIGTRPAFCAVGAIALGLALCVLGTPAPAAESAGPATSFVAMLRNGRVRAGLALLVPVALAWGAIYAVVPLRLSALGATGVGVGATFLVGSAAGAVTSPLAGSFADRRGRLLPIRASLVVAAPCLILLAVTRSAVALSALTVVYLGGVATVHGVAAAAFLTEAGAAARLESGVSAAIVAVYSLGEVIGAPTAAALAQATSDAVPFALLGVLSAATVLVLRKAAAVRQFAAPAAGCGDGPALL